MAKPNYQFAKRQRDLAKKQKKEQKKLKKAMPGEPGEAGEAGEGDEAGAEGEAPSDVNNPAATEAKAAG